MTHDLVIQPPLVTADLPGIGGAIKSTPEDFEVEEIPAYLPSGNGEFLYLWIEKRDMGADYFVRQLGRRLDIAPSEVGTAGLKDRHAMTRQWVSVPGRVEVHLSQLDGDGIRVLNVSRHTNKLRPGHLHGNRFRILIRRPENLERLPALIERLRQEGLPNFYGPQRFGRAGETLRLGMELMGGVGKKVRNPFLKKLALSAIQSALFNACLAQRLANGFFRVVLAGDVMAKLPFGGLFVVEDVAAEQKRFDAREIVTAGPIFGRKTFAAQGPAAERESQVLAAWNLRATSFAGFGKLLQGTRRHNLVYVNDLAWVEEAEGLRLSFTLPAGSYATTLLREVMKVSLSESDGLD